MAVTIKDVAREARVSVASVSRALNGSASVTEATRNHILKVASRLRYVPHSAARSLITRRTQTIGALLPELQAVADWKADAVETVVRGFAERTGKKLGAVAQPLRAALTGRTTSPPIFDVLAVLGADESLARLRDQAGV